MADQIRESVWGMRWNEHILLSLSVSGRFPVLLGNTDSERVVDSNALVAKWSGANSTNPLQRPFCESLLGLSLSCSSKKSEETSAAMQNEWLRDQWLSEVMLNLESRHSNEGRGWKVWEGAAWGGAVPLPASLPSSSHSRPPCANRIKAISPLQLAMAKTSAQRLNSPYIIHEDNFHTNIFRVFSLATVPCNSFLWNHS